MDVLQALLLGILQGLTEFLPVSSSGHIELGKLLLGTSKEGDQLLFTTIVHGATALSTIYVFRKRIAALFRNTWQGGPHNERTYVLKLLISTIPVGILGLLYKEEVESFFSGQPILVGSMLLVTALLLFMSNRASFGQKGVAYFPALIIGVAQAFAVMPGISRSGATISTALLLNVGRDRAAEFSFLMVLPPILGITLLDVLELLEMEGRSNIKLWPLVVGFGAAFISGVIACKWMLRIVQRARLSVFAIYCTIIGTLAIILGLTIGN